MKISCACERRLEFEVKKSERARLEAAMATGQRVIMLECGVCKKNILLNPQTLSLPVVINEVNYLCPVHECGGIVVHVDADGENFWGCGECGSVWSSQEQLLASGAKVQ
jgi:ubiquitin C-terminal hydrolase